MKKSAHAPLLNDTKNIAELPIRSHPYWNILEYCRHLGIEKKHSGKCYWIARVRRKDGKYAQKRLSPTYPFHPEGVDYEAALTLAKNWFDQPETKTISAQPFGIGTNSTLYYTKTCQKFTVGDAMHAFIEWKRIAAAQSYFETTLSLINHHIIPRLGNTPVEELNQELFTRFCVDVLEAAPKRGHAPPSPSTPLEDLDHERLRKRKKTLNTLIGLLRTAIEMAWENGDVESERSWRRLRRVPHADTPRQFFLTRSQAKRLIAACRGDLALLVQAALYTGCRVSELSRLRARDVGQHSYGIYVAPLKSRRGRHVVLPDEGMSFFLDQIDGLDEESHVFTMHSGKPWLGSHKHLFKDAVRNAELPERFVFHGLRHTYASQLVQAGTPLAVVAKQLGHTTTDTVSRTYGHLCCDGIETEISKRFAPLKASRNDPRLEQLKDTLQTREEPSWSWPLKNKSRSQGKLVALLKAKEEQHRHAQDRARK